MQKPVTLLIFVGLAGCAALGYWYFASGASMSWLERNTASVSGGVSPESAGTLVFKPSGEIIDPEEISIPEDPPPGYVKYTNQKYGFSFYHSPEATVKEYDEGGGAMTVVLQNVKTVRGLQVFIVPYSESTISDERFYADVPSRVRKDIQATTLGILGIPAVTFTSYDASLGETREIWFLYKGHLFEITTFRGIGDWLTPILKTWRFHKK